jgi:hypothetical protein
MLVFSSYRLIAATLLLTLVLLEAGPARADFQLACPQNGDAMGWAVAADGDMDRDGVNDIAIGAPCAWNGTVRRAGLAVVISGATGRVILRRRGEQESQFLGAGLAFLPGPRDKASLAVGSPGYDALVGVSIESNAGRVDVFRKGTAKLFEVIGSDRQGGLGESLVAVPALDISKYDLAIGASNHRDLSGARKGALFIVSGRDGAQISVRYGEKLNSGFSRQLALLPDGGDGGADLLAVGSQELNFNGVSNRGSVDVVSVFDTDTSVPGFPVYGAKGDRFGSGLVAAGDVDGDMLMDILVGSSHADDDGLNQAGVASVLSSDGEIIFSFSDPELQEKARFGSAVANIGDVNGDDVDDFAVGAPGFDSFDGGFNAVDAGRIVVVRGSDGYPLWSYNGTRTDSLLGQTLAGGTDYKGQGVGSVVAGAPGDYPKGRRGAGRVTIASGADGRILRRYRGKRGQETRIYVAGESTKGARAKSYKAFNSRRGSSTLLTGFSSGKAMSIAIIGDDGIGIPGEILLAAANGAGSGSSEIIIASAASSNKIERTFDAFDDAVKGVNIAAGLLLGLDREQLVAVEAKVTQGPGGDVRVRAFDRLDSGDDWFPYSEFVAFGGDETIVCNQTAIEQPINAGGATVAVGDVFGDPNDGIEEIVVGSAAGVPVVRVFSAAGEQLAEWCAFAPIDGIGVQVGILDTNAHDGDQVVTVPMLIAPQIRVYTGVGETVAVPGNPELPIAIAATTLPGLSGAIGGYAQGADVDFDGTQEIVFVAGNTDAPVVYALELDGTLTDGFKVTEAFQSFGSSGLVGLAVTDRFIND